uniref:Uncharacterized protein n=1 Tax=Rhizophora mucronata TaxID=61149 RepID=A0A2P2PHP0_RHIMU
MTFLEVEIAQLLGFCMVAKIQTSTTLTFKR